MAQVHLGTLQRSRLVLDVKRRARPSSEDYWDGNWLVVDMAVEMGSWTGRFDANLRCEEFDRFLSEVRHLNENLDSVAEFVTMEGWLRLQLNGDGLGHIAAKGEATDQPGRGDTLSFRMDFDQTYLPRLIAELQDVLKEFPVRGDRPRMRDDMPPDAGSSVASDLTGPRGALRRERFSGILGLVAIAFVGITWLASGILHEELRWTIAFAGALLLAAADYFLVAMTGYGLFDRLKPRRRG
jgi:hypothetical protein